MVSIATIGSTIIFGWGKAFDLHEVAYILKTFGSAVIVGMYNYFTFDSYSNPSKEQRIYYRNWYSSICPITHYSCFPI